MHPSASAYVAFLACTAALAFALAGWIATHGAALALAAL
jgi:hypothetical protein